VATGRDVSPLQYTSHEPLVAACRNAHVWYVAPDCWASVAGLSPVHISTNGANTCGGSGVAAWAGATAARTPPAARAAVAVAASAAVLLVRSMSTPSDGSPASRRDAGGACAPGLGDA